jgi:hypothetical protein
VKDRKFVKQDLSWDRYQWEEGGQKDLVNEDEYGGRTLYSCIKIELVGFVLRSGGGREEGRRENDG